MKKIILISLLLPFFGVAQIPVKNSYPAAKATVFLDFRGGEIKGTIWNTNGPISVEAPALSKGDIEAIHRDVAQAFELFNLNITTDPDVYDAAPVMQRSRIVFAPAGDWYGPVGGVACTGSFCWGNETPAFVFTEKLGNDPSRLAASALHQIGHVLGLGHQSVYDGHGYLLSDLAGGETSAGGKAPFMGVAYYRQGEWTNGRSSFLKGAIQSDTAIIAGVPNGFGYRKQEFIPATGSRAVIVASPVQRTIHVTSDDNYQYRLYTSSGQLVGQGRLNSGSNDIPAMATAPGLLVLEWHNAGRRGSEKIIKQ